MSILNNIVALVALLFVSILIILTVHHFYKKAVEAKLQAEMDIEDKEMERHYEITKSDYLDISDRLKVQVTNHKAHWFSWFEKGKPVRTHLRFEDLIAVEELSPQERRSLDACMDHLQNVRDFREKKVTKPTGVVVRNHPKFGRLCEYTPGLKILGDRNKVAIVTEKSADGTIYIDEIHISLDLGNEIADVFKISEGDDFLSFQDEYKNDEDMSAAFAPEFERYNEVLAEIDTFNKHVKHLHFKEQDAVLEYHYDRKTPRDERNNYKNAPII
jgi:hypothetical protein